MLGEMLKNELLRRACATRRNALGYGGSKNRAEMSKPRCLFLLLFSLLCLSPACACQTVKVRVVNERNGHPLKGQHVHLSFVYGDNRTKGASPLNLQTTFDSSTNKSGEAEFSLPQPAPDFLSVQVRPTAPYSDCTCTALVSPDEVREEGYARAIIGRPAPGTKPGEILIQVHLLNFFQRLLYPFEKW